MKNLKLLLLVTLLSIGKYTAGEMNALDREVAKMYLSELRASNISWEVEPQDGKALQACRSKLLDMFERVIESESSTLTAQEEPIINACLDKLHALEPKYCTDVDKEPNSFFETLMLAEYRFARKCDCNRMKWMIDSYEDLRKESLSNTNQLQPKEVEEHSKK